MLELCKQQGLTLKVSDRLFVLRVVEVRLDHFLDRARRVAEIAVLRKINGAHATAADAPHNFIAMSQDFAGFQGFGLAAARGSPTRG